MSEQKKYIAASVPRFIRQTRLGYLPINCIVGTHITRGEGGMNLIFDVVMLPQQEFQRMRTNVGMSYAPTPELKPGGSSFHPSFIPADTKQVTVPTEVDDPVSYARAYFVQAFNLDAVESSSAGSALDYPQAQILFKIHSRYSTGRRSKH